MIRHILNALAAAMALTGFCAAAFADDPVMLRYGDPGPTDAAIHTLLVGPWADKVNKEGAGALDVHVFVGYSLVNMVNTLDRVADGVADMAFCILGPVSSQFPRPWSRPCRSRRPMATRPAWRCSGFTKKASSPTSGRR